MTQIKVVALDPGTRLVPLTQGQFAVVDEADYEAVMQYKWQFVKTRYGGYAKRAWRDASGCVPKACISSY